MFGTEISTPQLASLCHRLSTVMAAGIDARSAWAEEAQSTPSPWLRRKLAVVAAGVAQGQSIRQALDQTGHYFPLLFREMVQVGDEAGRLPETLAELGRQYDFRISLQRKFLVQIAWPLIQLGLALTFIGILIYLIGVVRDLTGMEDFDLLGWGLVGFQGVCIYATLLMIIAIALFLLHKAFQKGMAFLGPLQIALLKIPAVGKVLNTLALARMSWAMSITTNSGMDIRRAVKLSLGASRNAQYSGQAKKIDRFLEQGGNLVESFRMTGAFPEPFMSALRVGEQTGRTPEEMERLTADYQEQAEAAAKLLSTIGSVVVFLLVGAIIIMLIMQVAGFYFGLIYDVVENPMGNP